MSVEGVATATFAHPFLSRMATPANNEPANEQAIASQGDRPIIGIPMGVGCSLNHGGEPFAPLLLIEGGKNAESESRRGQTGER